jgi:hypothetical protein
MSGLSLTSALTSTRTVLGTSLEDWNGTGKAVTLTDTRFIGSSDEFSNSATAKSNSFIDPSKSCAPV